MNITIVHDVADLADTIGSMSTKPSHEEISEARTRARGLWPPFGTAYYDEDEGEYLVGVDQPLSQVGPGDQPRMLEGDGWYGRSTVSFAAAFLDAERWLRSRAPADAQPSSP
jgi:hypothetical protein